MKIKGGLVSNIAVVKRFQTENIEVHPSDSLLFSLEFRNHMWW